MNRTQFSYRRHLYKIIFAKPDETIDQGEVVADGFTSQKAAMDWLKENNLRCARYYYLVGYSRK